MVAHFRLRASKTCLDFSTEQVGPNGICKGCGPIGTIALISVAEERRLSCTTGPCSLIEAAAFLGRQEDGKIQRHR